MKKLFIFLMFSLLLFASVSAWTYDNFIEDTQKISQLNTPTKYGTYEITKSEWYDFLGIFGTEEIVKRVALENNTDKCVDCLAEGNVENLKDGKIFSDVEWLRSFDNQKTWVEWKGFVNWKLYIENKNRYVEVPTYETICVDSKEISKNGTIVQECSSVESGTQIIDNGEWEVYDFNKEYLADNYKWKLEGSKKGSTVLDWVLVTAENVKLSEWAVWGNISLGDDAEVILNSPADDSIQYTRDVTINFTANVTGGAYLTNATGLVWNSNGSLFVSNTSSFGDIGGGGLVSYYTLDETSGTTVFDSLGLHNGTNNGATVGVTGKIGTAYDFDGTNDYITTNQNLFYSNSRITNNKLEQFSGSWRTATTTLAQNEWIMLTIVLYSNGSGQFYVNGTIDGTFTGGAHNVNRTMNLWVYNRQNDGTLFNNDASDGKMFWRTAPDSPFNGIADEIGFWNTTVSQSEITQLYNSGAGLRPTTTNTTQTFTNTFVAGETYIWTGSACDTDGDCGFAPSNFTFTIDPTPPSITILGGSGLQNYGNYQTNHTITYFVNDTNLDSCWIEYNGTNRTDSCVNAVPKYYNFSLATNIFNATVWANDSAGNTFGQNFNWSYKVFENSRTFNAITRAGSIENYTLNVTLGSGVNLISSNLMYGNETISTNIFSSGQNRILSLTDYETPLYNVDTNVSFYWALNITDSIISTYNSTQLVQAVLLDNCSTYNYTLFNLSLYNEETKTPIYGNIQLNYNLLNKPNYGIINTINLSLNNVTNSRICSGINLSEENVAYSTEIRYESEGFVPEFYHIQRADISPTANVLKLYDLNQNDSTEFKIIYQDNNYNFIEGAVVQLQRKYISEDLYEIVEAPLTSNEGTAVVHIDLNTNKYRATIVKNGVLLDTFDNLVFKCQSQLTGECTQQLLGTINPQNSQTLEQITDLVLSDPVVLNDTISVSFSVPSGSPSSIGITLVQKDVYANKTLCNKTITSSAGSLDCEYSKTLGDSFITFQVTKDGNIVSTREYFVPQENNMDFLGNNYIIVILLLLSLVGMAFTSPEWIILNGVITFVVAGALWLLSGLDFVVGLGNLMWLVIASAILIFKLAKQEDR